MASRGALRKNTVNDARLRTRRGWPIELRAPLALREPKLGPPEDGLHLLRHTSGSLVYRRAADVKTAQEWLGHSTSKTTMHTFVHLMQDAQREAAQNTFSRPAVRSEQVN